MSTNTLNSLTKLIFVLTLAGVSVYGGVQINNKVRTLDKELLTTSTVAKDLEERARKLEEQKAEVERRVEEVSLRSEQQEDLVSALGEDRQSLRETIQRIQREKRDLQAELERVVMQKNQNLRDLESRLEPLESAAAQLGQKENLLQQSVSELKELRFRAAALEEALVASVSNLGRAESQLDQALLELEVPVDKRVLKNEEKLKQDLEGIRGYAKQVEVEKRELINQIKELDLKLTETLRQVSQVEKENQTLRKQAADMHYNLGVILTEMRKVRPAIAEYQKVFEIRPDDAEAHYNIAILYDQELEDPLKALEHYRAYMKLRPNAPDSQIVHKWIIDKELESKVQH